MRSFLGRRDRDQPAATTKFEYFFFLQRKPAEVF